MKLLSDILLLKIKTRTLVYGIFIFLLSSLPLKAQTNARTIQDLSFGIFYTGSTGGTVIMPSVGSRSATGSVILFSSDQGNPALITVELGPNNSYTLTAGNVVNLTNGSGGAMKLQIDDFYPLSPFVSDGGVPHDYDFYIGGTLTVGSPTVSTAGNYSGSFDITFNKQ